MKRKEKGFTLIELVVVMVILGVLAVIAVPKYIDLTQQAKIASPGFVVELGQGGQTYRYYVSSTTVVYCQARPAIDPK